MTLREKIELLARFKLWAPWRIDRYHAYYLSHSMFGEDMVLRSLTADCPPGFYVDLGAHHPVFSSNTYHFYRRGWRGLNVDALPGSMEAFKLLRPRDINVEACLGLEPAQPVEYFMFDQPPYNTIDPAKAEQVRGLGVRQIEVRTLRTVTLGQLLDRCLPRGLTIDLLSVDVESLDEALLLAHDWQRFPARIVVFESNEPALAAIDRLPVVSHLRQFGYAPVARCGLSVVLADATIRSKFFAGLEQYGQAQK